MSILRAQRGFTVLDTVDLLPHFRDRKFFKFSQLSETEIKDQVENKGSKFSEFLKKLNVNGISFSTMAQILVVGIQHVGKNGASVKHVTIFNNAVKPCGYDGVFNEKSNCILLLSVSQTYQSTEFDQVLETLKVHEVVYIFFLYLILFHNYIFMEDEIFHFQLSIFLYCFHETKKIGFINWFE